MKVTLADKLSVAPVLQQVVGLGTVGLNVGKIAIDLFKHATGYNKKINKKIQEIKDHFKRPFKGDGDLGPIDAKPRALNELPQVCKLESKKSHLIRHIKWVGIGILRMIPVAGTVYSACVWYKATHHKKPKENAEQV